MAPLPALSAKPGKRSWVYAASASSLFAFTFVSAFLRGLRNPRLATLCCPLSVETYRPLKFTKLKAFYYNILDGTNSIDFNYISGIFLNLLRIPMKMAGLPVMTAIPLSGSAEESLEEECILRRRTHLLL